MSNKIRAYKKEFDYSYTLGASITIEMLKTRPQAAERVYVHSSYRDFGGIKALCDKARVPCEIADKVFNIASPKENCLVLGVFNKYEEVLASNAPHVVLVNPSDMGNLGTIIRAMAGMNLKNLAVIEPAADLWHPKTVRAGMGASFHIRCQKFLNFTEYRERFAEHKMFPFMLSGQTAPEDVPRTPLFSLIFGNEAHGLNESFAQIGQSVRIPSCDDVDSFNLSVAAAIGLYSFARKNELI